MYCKHLLTRSFAVIFAVILISNAAVLGNRQADDMSDAWVSVNQMIKFIGMGERPGTERAGNEAIGSIEKVLDVEKDSSKRGKLVDAKTEVKQALSALSYEKPDWSHAEGAAKRALKLLEEVK